MTKRFSVFVFLFLCASVAQAQVSPQLRFADFHEVHMLAELPVPIKNLVGASEIGLDGIAEKHMPFNATDLVNAALPMRRFLTAGYSKREWLVAVENGGRGYHVQVYLIAGDRIEAEWNLAASQGQLPSLEAIVESAANASGIEG